MSRTLTGRRRYVRTLIGRLVLQVEETQRDLVHVPQLISLDQLDARERTVWRDARLDDILAADAHTVEAAVDSTARQVLLPLVKAVPGALAVQIAVAFIAWGLTTTALGHDASFLAALLSPHAFGLALAALGLQAALLFSPRRPAEAARATPDRAAPNNRRAATGAVPAHAHDGPSRRLSGPPRVGP